MQFAEGAEVKLLLFFMLYLVTGVAGFIGSSLARALLERGESIRGIDNFSTGRRENLEGLERKLDLRELDLGEYSVALEAACEGVDYILHQAALPSVPRSIADPRASHHSNANGTLNLLLAARKAKDRDRRLLRIVYAGSSSVYGDTPDLPKREEMRPNPISPYAVSKLAGELYMQSFYRCYGLETVTLRYFNVFGPRQDPGSQYSGVISRFITAMLRGETPVIYGDGLQSRDFTFIDNVVSANLLACSAPAERVCGRVFNTATGRQITLNETFATLKRIIRYEGGSQYGPARQGDIVHSTADIAEAKKSLDFRVLIDFEEGLKRTVAWYRGRLEREVATASKSV